MKKILFLLAFFALLGTQSLYAQSRVITGKVTSSEDNLGFPGANVFVKGMPTIGTSTDVEGNYSITVPADATTLIYSFVGMNSKEVVIGNRTVINVVLEPSLASLEEIVVVGYGKQSKRNVTDNIASLTSDKINEIPVAGFQGALTGKAAGVQIQQINGKVEAGVKMRIRGISTISSSQEPLYVLDGMPIINDDESATSAPINPLISLNPNDIESIQILKDASSAAIYGARGTNGVVLITTKQGKSGKTKVSFNTSTGWSQATHKMKWLNAEQYVELFKEADVNTYGEEDLPWAEGYLDWMANGKDWRNGEVDTDWQDYALVKGGVQNYDLSISGGDAKTLFFLSSGYNKTEGIVRGNNLDRYSFRGNLDHNISDKFKVGFTSSISKSIISRLGTDNSFQTPLQAIALAPISPAYLDDGVTPNNETTSYYNFLMQEYNGNWDVNIFRVILNTYLNYQILPELSVRSEFGYDNNNQVEEYFAGSMTESASTNGYADANMVQSDKYSFNNYLTYNKVFNDAYDFEFLGGMSFEQNSRSHQFLSGTGFPSDDLQTIASASEITSGTTSRTKYNFLSYFGRANLIINNKYLFKGSLRYDGSSRFGADNRYGLFPAASVGWILSEEDFIKSNDKISLLKLRGSYGTTGNAGIGNFASLGLFGGTAYNQRSALTPVQLGNPDLRWEKTTQFDFGLDFGLFENRLTGEIDYYIKNTNDLLLNEPIPGTSGYTSITRNVGSMTNKGFEFVLNTDVVRSKDLTWKTSLNISTLKNEVTNLPGGDIISGRNLVREGETISSFYIVEYAGVDPANGDALFYLNTENADGSLNKTTTNDYNSCERIVAGSPYPTLMAGLTNTMTYKDFDFSFTFQGEHGASIYNEGGKFQSGNMRYEDNQTADQMDRWQNPGDITMVPQARLYRTNGQQASTRYLEKSDFIRLRNLSLGYTMPDKIAKKISAERVRVYFTGINLLTFTNYTGYDPESTYDNNGNSNIQKGIAFYSAPPAKTFMIGVNIDF